MADGPKAEDFKPDGPVRQPFMFDMMKGDDAGAGFPMLQLPPKEDEEPRAPKRKAHAPSSPHRFLRLRIQKPTRNFLLAVFGAQALVVAANVGLPRIVAIPASLELPLLVLVSACGLAAIVGVVATAVMLLKRGVGGAVKAVAFSLLAGVLVGATAFLMVPYKNWRQVPANARVLVDKGWSALKSQRGMP
jgi:hypothetical protein